ncbi:unnamed protein product [Moneuplotes crassus]|uniref:Uncharacterized protein n=1 Tax=Euplotes crassus TaxID=5936 RepID=A0AAD2D0U9_EUPCR|nr:unnamed protein product [Moneuplotes crassus]
MPSINSQKLPQPPKSLLISLSPQHHPFPTLSHSFFPYIDPPILPILLPNPSNSNFPSCPKTWLLCRLCEEDRTRGGEIEWEVVEFWGWEGGCGWLGYGRVEVWEGGFGG